MAGRARVLTLTDSLQVGGAEQVAVDIANSLDRSQFDIFFCSTRLDGPLRSTLRDDVEVLLLDRRSRWDVRALRRFESFVRANRIEIIHSHGRGTMQFVSLLKAAGRIRAHHVFHDHFGQLHIDRSAPRSLEIPLRTQVDAYLGVEARLCDWAVRKVGLDSSKVHLARSGVDLTRFEDVAATDLRQEFGLPADTVVLAMVANFRPQKDHPTLFRAIAELPDHLREPLRVVLCGSTTSDEHYHRRCMELAQRLGVAQNLVVAGTRPDAPSVLAGADGAVFTSKNESGPLVILEYMAAGLPFVASDTGEIVDAVRDLGVGFLAEPRDHEETSQALVALLELSEEERTSMGRRASELVRTQFDQRISVRTVERVYLRLLADAPRQTDRRRVPA